ncbi:hypothetical protein SAMN02745163_03401 [Clostridium cavendishii DSM 21758]|uniref:Uncharacterized protein n=1 Tax=Clostridium cavendishii DSM 21758 TaxID=1121302 RepID=A0A1M6QGZ8_9CLOT|nr:DUF5702 domain-containing protein [Clostridium cavendishii]SHK19519.1 hypothetical protein SAMN02745163_03401 [Clostridium cavendishii DSM 21758]
MYKKNGSITVFLSLIIVIVVSLIGGLVDGARMRTADAQVNRAVQNGLESALASYNKPLKQRYELFAYDKGDGNLGEEVKNIAMMNLVPDKSSGDYTDLYNYNIDSLNLGFSGPLQQNKVLEDQILQAMKYRAPINILEGIIEKLDIFKGMGKYKKTLEEKEELDKEMKSIDKELDKIANDGKEVDDLIKSVKADKNIDNTQNLDDSKDKMKKLKTKIENFEKKLKDARPQYEAYKNSVKDIPGGATDGKTGVSKDKIKSGFDKEFKEYEKIFESKADEGIKKNLKIMEENEKVINEIEQAIKSVKEREAKLDEEWSKVKPPESPSKGKDESDEDYNKREEAYDNAMKSYERERENYEKEKANLAKEKEGIKNKYNSLKQLDYEENRSQKEADKKAMGEQLKKDDDNAKDNTKEEDSKSKKSIDKSFKLPSQNKNTQDFIKELENFSGSDNSGMKQSLGYMGDFSSLEQDLMNLRNTLYINEYVMTKFKDRVVGDDITKKFRIPMMVTNENSGLDYEIEYIISGRDSDESNGKINWWKIYATRVLVNSISIRNISECRRLIEEMAIATTTALAFFGIPVNPTWLKALYTAAWVAYESKLDMDWLLKGHKVPLIKSHDLWVSKKVLDKDQQTLDSFDNLTGKEALLSTIYSDYLRVFLLLQSKDETLGKIKDIIQLNMKKENSSFDLENQYTVINATGNASIKYLFFNLEFMDPKVRKTGRYNIPIKQSIAF